jgi:hypothetical protein
LVCLRKFKPELGPDKRWVIDLDFRAAVGKIQHRTFPGCETAVDCHPRVLEGFPSGRARLSSE